MATDLPTRARVVIVGGGVIGCSIAYHLSKLGWSDIVLLERKQLTSGTTWHAAGLIGQLRQSMNMTRLARYTAELYRGLEAETGQATGYRQCGSDLARDHRGTHGGAQAQRLHGQGLRTAGARREPGRDRRAVSARQSRGCDRRHSHPERRLRATPSTSPRRSPRARARAACGSFQDLKVTADPPRRTARHRRRDRAAARIDADYVVLCGGMWTRDLAASIGVTVPLHACEHYYVLFQDVPGLDSELPVLRDYDHCSYFKYDAGKLLVGAFEPHARPWGTGGIPEDFSFGEIAGDFAHFEPVLLDAMRRIPALEQAGIQKFFCGPESFTPDVRYHLGEVARARELLRRRGPELHRPAVRGRHRQGGVGMDPRRASADGSVGGGRPAQHALPEQPQVSARAGLARAWGSCTRLTGRSGSTRPRAACAAPPCTTVWRAAGACFGEAFGWERANWYAPAGVAAGIRVQLRPPELVRATAPASTARVRSAVGLFDQSSFAKFRLEGADAAPVLNRVCANDVDVAPGRIVYTQWLNERGGIEADLTVTRLSESAYLIVTGAETETKDFNWLKRHIEPEARCVLTNVTSGMGVLSVMGPRARELLQSLTPEDLSDTAFPFATSREIELGVRAGARLAHHLCRRARLGALRSHRIHGGRVRGDRRGGGAPRVWCTRATTRSTRCASRKPTGIRAMTSPMRTRRGRRVSGFAVKLDKPGGFIGREALLRQRDAGLREAAACSSSFNRPSPCSTTTSRSGGAMPSSATSAPACTGTRSAPPWAWATWRARRRAGAKARRRRRLRDRGRRRAPRGPRLAPAPVSTRRTSASSAERDASSEQHAESGTGSRAIESHRGAGGRRPDRATAWISASTATTRCSRPTCARSSSRKWIVAGHVDQRAPQGRLLPVQDRQGVDHRRAQRRIDRQCLLQRLPPSRVGDLHRVERAAWRASPAPTTPGPTVSTARCLRARLMPADFSKADNGLHRCHVRVFHGFIFINLSEQDPVDFDATFADLAPYLDFHGLADARIAHARVLSHDGQLEARGRELRRVLSLHAGASGIQLHASAAGAHRLRCGTELGAARGGERNTCRRSRPGRRARRRSAGPSARSTTAPNPRICGSCCSGPSARGIESETQDGTPAAPLMGKRKGFDQGRMYLSFSPFTQLVATNDFAVLFLFTPRGTSSTDVDLYWLVDGKADRRRRSEDDLGLGPRPPSRTRSSRRTTRRASYRRAIGRAATPSTSGAW